MKVLASPRTGKISNQVFYQSAFGLCARELVIPRDAKSPAQVRMREFFGWASRVWGLKFTENQREHWVTAAQTVPSHPSLNQYSQISGQQLAVKINSTLRCVGQQPTSEPPQPVVFSPNSVGELTIDYDEAGNVRLLLAVGAVVEDIMLFGQAPCSAGRMKHRRVCYLGLAGLAVNGRFDITAPYVARYGQPAPGQKVFVVTCQHKNGWKAQDHVTSAIVPPRPPLAPLQARPEPKVLDCGTPVPLSPREPQIRLEPKAAQSAAPEAPQSQSARPQGASPLSRLVYKGSAPGARVMHTGLKRVHPLRILCTPLVHGLRVAVARLGGLRMAGVAPELERLPQAI